MLFKKWSIKIAKRIIDNYFHKSLKMKLINNALAGTPTEDISNIVAPANAKFNDYIYCKLPT